MNDFLFAYITVVWSMLKSPLTLFIALTFSLYLLFRGVDCLLGFLINLNRFKE